MQEFLVYFVFKKFIKSEISKITFKCKMIKIRKSIAHFVNFYVVHFKNRIKNSNVFASNFTHVVKLHLNENKLTEFVKYNVTRL